VVACVLGAGSRLPLVVLVTLAELSFSCCVCYFPLFLLVCAGPFESDLGSTVGVFFFY
jgi:hypothetical protein